MEIKVEIERPESFRKQFFKSLGKNLDRIIIYLKRKEKGDDKYEVLKSKDPETFHKLIKLGSVLQWISFISLILLILLSFIITDDLKLPFALPEQIAKLFDILLVSTLVSYFLFVLVGSSLNKRAEEAMRKHKEQNKSPQNSS